MPGILDSYLVSLGFRVDTVGYAGFSNALRDASSLIDNQYLKMAKNVLGFQAAATGAFAAVAAGAIGLTDKVAMADQDYRLLAMHMFTSLPVARELKVALDALGQPLENVMWDKELSGRFHQLVKDQQTMTQHLGPDFEKQMRSVRDVRFEFSRLGVEVKYLSMGVTADLARAFGVDNLADKLHEFNDWFVANMPQITAYLETKLKPILGDVREILGDVWDLTKQITIDFIHFVGLLSGDNALANAPLTFDSLAEAIQKTTDKITSMTDALLKTETNMALLLDAGMQASSGNYQAALADLRQMQVIVSSAGVNVPKNLQLVGAGPGLATKANVQQAIVAASQQIGLDPQLALAVAGVESNFQQFDPTTGKPMLAKELNPATGKWSTEDFTGRKSHATGIFQVQPETAKQFGFDPNDPGENIAAAVMYMKQLENLFGNDNRKALQAYFGGPGGFQKNPTPDMKSYADKVLNSMSSYTQVQAPNISLTINATSPASAEDIGNQAQQKISDLIKSYNQGNVSQFKEAMRQEKAAKKNETQRNLSEFQTPGWSY